MKIEEGQLLNEVSYLELRGADSSIRFRQIAEFQYKIDTDFYFIFASNAFICAANLSNCVFSTSNFSIFFCNLWDLVN